MFPLLQGVLLLKQFMLYFFDFIREIFRGKTVSRILLNWEIKKQSTAMRGEILDLAGGAGASYERYLPATAKIIKTDYRQAGPNTQRIDLNQPLPFIDNSWKNIFLFGAIYILEDSLATLRELKRIKSADGVILLSSPFIAGEIPEPHDYLRFTGEGLARQLTSAGFTDFEIIRLGGRFSAAANLLHSAYYFNAVRLVAYSVALLADKLLNAWEIKHPCPITYFCVIKN